MHDMTTHSASGELCNTSNGRPIIWNGHLCEGASLAGRSSANFCLWTLCGRDVPANQAKEGDWGDAECLECLRHGDG